MMGPKVLRDLEVSAEIAALKVSAYAALNDSKISDADANEKVQTFNSAWLKAGYPMGGQLITRERM